MSNSSKMLAVVKPTAIALPPQASAAIIEAGQRLPDDLRLDAIGLQVAFATRAMEEDERALRVEYITEALTGFEQFIAAYVLRRVRVRNPAGRFAPDATLIWELCTATRKALRNALLRTCLDGRHWCVLPTDDLPMHWFENRPGAAPFEPGSLVPDDAACRWIREYVTLTADLDELRKVANWSFRDCRCGYSFLPAYVRQDWNLAAIKRLPDAALPEGFCTAYEAAIARLSQLRQEEDNAREKEAAATEERRRQKYGIQACDAECAANSGCVQCAEGARS